MITRKIQSVFLIALVAATCSVTARAAEKPSVTNDLAQLQGAWTMVSASADGQAMPDEMLKQMKIQKLDIEMATLMEKTVNTTQDVYTDYKGSHRMVVLMKNQPYKCFVSINFSDEDCEMPINYILVSYNENANEFDLRKFAETKKELFVGNCDENNNDKEIRKFLEQYNIAFFKEKLEE